MKEDSNMREYDKSKETFTKEYIAEVYANSCEWVK